jgi:hypothetical protein
MINKHGQGPHDLQLGPKLEHLISNKELQAGAPYLI